jgi:hypothetical protein
LNDKTLPAMSRRTFIAAAATSSVAATTSLRPASAEVATTAHVVRASSFGHDPDDATDALQAALDSDADTVIIDKVPGGWTTRPLVLARSNVTIMVEPGVMVRAKAGGFPGTSDCLLKITDQSNITISGYGAVFAMNKPEYTSGEYRMALKLSGVSNVTVEGLTLRDSGGDGVYVGKGAKAYCQDVTLRDLLCADNRRNGLSVVTVDGLTVEGCAFTQTNGTSPQHGVDIEPNPGLPTQRLSNIVFRDCVLQDNLSGGIEISPRGLAGSTTPISILLERTTVGRQVGGLPSVEIIQLPDDVDGSIELRDSLLDVSAGSGALGVFATSPSGARVIVNRTSIWDWGNSFQVFEPIVIMASRFGGEAIYSQYGGITLTDSVVVTDQAPPFLRAYDVGDDNGLTDVQGTVTVADPYGVRTDFGANPSNVNLAIRTEGAGNPAPVDVQAEEDTVAGGQDAHLTFTRLGGDLTTPLAIAYQTSGTARERYDYGGLGKVAVIPPGKRQATIAVRTFPRRQDSDPRLRSLVVTIAPGFRYDARPGAARIVIS